MSLQTMSCFCCLVVLIFLGINVTGQGHCPDGFREHEQNCYKYIFINATWVHAREFCHSLGAHLLMIESDSEQRVIGAELVNLKVNTFARPNRYWIGATDIFEHGIYLWSHDSSALSYVHWLSGNPNDARGNEDCVEMFGGPVHHYWNDRECDVHNNFVCETSISQPGDD